MVKLGSCRVQKLHWSCNARMVWLQRVNFAKGLPLWSEGSVCRHGAGDVQKRTVLMLRMQ